MSKGITLYTAATPNGYKISIALEELGLKYTVQNLDFSKLEQKAPAFLKVNPNGRVPAIVDHDNNDLAIWESGSCLIYLAEKYGKGRLLPTDDKGRADVISWLMWQMAGQGPMQGQCNFFTHYFTSKQPATVQRFVTETNRLYGVLDEQLSKNEFVAGPTLSIADIAVCGWALYVLWAGIDIKAFPHVDKWMTGMRALPSVKAGMVPVPAPRPMLEKMHAAATDPAVYAEFLAEIRVMQALTE